MLRRSAACPRRARRTPARQSAQCDTASPRSTSRAPRRSSSVTPWGSGCGRHWTGSAPTTGLPWCCATSVAATATKRSPPCVRCQWARCAVGCTVPGRDCTAPRRPAWMARSWRTATSSGHGARSGRTSTTDCTKRPCPGRIAKRTCPTSTSATASGGGGVSGTGHCTSAKRSSSGCGRRSWGSPPAGTSRS